MKKISCKKLAELINESNIFSEMQFTSEVFRNKCEAYGRDVHCYFYIKDDEKRGAVRRLLSRNNVKMSAYGIKEVIDISVTYFKAWHWNE